jgi:hypothetical protein
MRPGGGKGVFGLNQPAWLAVTSRPAHLDLGVTQLSENRGGQGPFVYQTSPQQ